MGLLLSGLLLRCNHLDAPLLEGAAAKQTHTAMVARNLYRGRASWLRPLVDDIGRPGYFLKEVPLVPGTAALAYRLTGRVDERAGRLIGIVAWLAGSLFLHAIVRRSVTNGVALLAVAWFLAAPLGIVYSRAFMSDAALVAASLAAFLTLLRWRDGPSAARALAVGLFAGLSLALKPHAVFWLVPAGIVLCRATSAPRRAASGRELTMLLACLTIGATPPAVWYAHAFALHRVYPAAGAMVADGWVAPRLLLDPALYLEIARQIVQMVFTPLGLVVTLIGLALHHGDRTPTERALLAWGIGTIAQCLVFATRMLDQRARGTEYYLLPLVPVAALLLAQGCASVSAWIESRFPRAGNAAVAGLFALLLVSGITIARRAAAIPPQYGSLLERCERVRSLTGPSDELFVLSDRGGTVLYYCDRRGTALTLGNAVGERLASETARASDADIAKALQGARYIYVPFPELLDSRQAFAESLERDWRRVPGAEDLWLFERGDGNLRRRAP
ncbi:glycosyltransferase family 39 protein [Candidatus Binatia bacterium]|nr:glycosyltransferase family 39 protein [Candidatus Binatia bacterium]